MIPPTWKIAIILSIRLDPIIMNRIKVYLKKGTAELVLVCNIDIFLKYKNFM